jgi:DNA-binding transcriptional regulator of glucitol operon
MIIALVIIIAVLLIALWISVMALWWQHAQGYTEPLEKKDVIRQWNKAERLARRSWYNTLRYSKQAALWGNKKVSNAFVAIFPKSKPAFVEPDLLTGLEHGPSSYFLASLSKPISSSAKATARRRKKVIEVPAPIEVSEHLSD